MCSSLEISRLRTALCNSVFVASSSRSSSTTLGASAGAMLPFRPTCGSGLSSDAKCNPPRRFDIGKVVQDLRSVAMRSYSHLSEDERDQIGVLRAAGRSMGAIARALGRAKATISRELQRNALPLGGYSPLHAAGAYQLRRRREAILEREAALRLFVGDRLAEGWTPEQISGWLKSGNEPRLRAIGCETIYAFIYRTAQKAAALWRYLTRRHKRRRPRRARASRDAIKDRASIHDRPKTLEAAARPAIGRATSSSANAHGLCSSCMSA